MQLHDFVGFVGIALILGAYFLLQSETIRSSDLKYSAFNCIGALCVLYSICFDFNLSAFIIEAFWVVISAIGILRYLWGTGTTERPDS